MNWIVSGAGKPRMSQTPEASPVFPLGTTFVVHAGCIIVLRRVSFIEIYQLFHCTLRSFHMCRILEFCTFLAKYVLDTACLISSLKERK